MARRLFSALLFAVACHAREPEVARVELPPPLETPPPATSATLDTQTAVDACAKARTQEIYVESPHRVWVTRTWLESTFESGEVGSSGRAGPEVGRDGGVRGIRIFALVSGGMLSRLAFANGDVIEMINGRALTNAESALDAYTTIRDANTIVVGMSRDQTPVEHVIHVCN